ncbi:hypothetical protein EDD85DRAFT_939492 [Armillaria nabsnona]|nr:hypothetical protein EDD85DRAFT_939492 [Armillaria nabsnona]
MDYHWISYSCTVCEFISIPQTALIYADAVGDLTKPCLVFVHGLALSGAVFDNLFTNPNLIANFYLVRYDTRGHGRSAMPESLDDYSSEIFAEDFKAAAQAFKVEKPIFIGWYGVIFSSRNQTHAALSGVLEVPLHLSLSCAVFVLMYPIGTVVCDIAAHLPKDTLAGVVYLAALPFIGPIMGRVGTPLVLGFLPGLFSTDDVNLSTKTTIDFVDSLFADPKNVPFSFKTSCLGTALVSEGVQ